MNKRGVFSGFSLGYVCRYLSVLFFYLALSGCCLINPVEKSPSELSNLKSGETAFFQKEYRKADAIFTLLSKQSKDPAIRNIARYNLACTKLMQYETESDFAEVIELLSQWHLVNPSSNSIANTQLLIPSLRKIADERKRMQKIVDEKKQSELEQFKKNQAMNTLIKHQNEKIIKLEKVIETLQYQISELEHIDQEIQEKRKTN